MSLTQDEPLTLSKLMAAKRMMCALPSGGIEIVVSASGMEKLQTLDRTNYKSILRPRKMKPRRKL